jgi:hypothetical protein
MKPSCPGEAELYRGRKAARAVAAGAVDNGELLHWGRRRKDVVCAVIAVIDEQQLGVDTVEAVSEAIEQRGH